MISLRKINSLLVIIIFLMILNHAVLSILFMYGFISYSPDFQITGRRLFYPIVAHIIISLYLYFSDRKKQSKTYPKLISETTQQVITGIFIIVFVSLHILNYMLNPINSSYDFWVILSHYLVDNLLFISIALHLRVSIPRLMLSFGFLEAKNAYQNFKRKTNIVILIILIVFMLAEFMFYVGA